MKLAEYCKTKAEANKLVRDLKSIGHNVLEVVPAGNYRGAGYIVRWETGQPQLPAKSNRR